MVATAAVPFLTIIHLFGWVVSRDKAATALKGVVNVGAVDGTVSQKLSQKYQIQGFPTIKIFGADKRSPTEYQVGHFLF